MNWCFSTKLRFKCVCDNPKQVDVFACGSSTYIDRHSTFVIGHTPRSVRNLQVLVVQVFLILSSNLLILRQSVQILELLDRLMVLKPSTTFCSLE